MKKAIFMTLAILIAISGAYSQDTEEAKKKVEKGIQDYLKDLKSSNLKTKIEAITKLGDLGAKEAVDELINILKDKNNDYKARYSAAISLGKIKDEKAIEPLGEALLNDPNPVVRYSSLLALLNFKDKRVLDYISKAYDKETDPEVKDLLTKIKQRIEKGE